MGNFFLLGFSTEEYSTMLSPGAVAHIAVRPQLPCRLQGLIVDEDCARGFELLDLRIGRDSKFLTSAPVPLPPYAVNHSLLEHYRRADRIGELRLWDMGHVRSHQDVELVVKNIGRDSWHFAAHMVCQACEPEPGVKLLPQAAADRSCASCRLADTLTTLAPGLAWCHCCGSLAVEDVELRDKLRHTGAKG